MRTASALEKRLFTARLRTAKKRTVANRDPGFSDEGVGMTRTARERWKDEGLLLRVWKPARARSNSGMIPISDEEQNSVAATMRKAG